MTADLRLELSNVTLGYDRVPVVRGLDIALKAGEILAILGPNGAGKSTTINACSGFVKAMSGSVVLDGETITGVSPQALCRRGVSQVPEGRGIFLGLTVSEHLRVAGGGDAARAALSHFPALSSLQDRKAGLLSGGQQQMLALACALARRPRLLLIDELSLGLAPIIVEQLLPVVRSFANESGCSVILVEQHVALALEIADSGLVLAHGETVLKADAATLKADRGLLMASYMGTTSDNT